MSPAIKGSVRRNQLITTYGVGAVLALEDESFMVMGIDRWNVSEPNLHEPRLERQLSVQGFATPPAVADDLPDIPVGRFPEWQFCPTCTLLEKHAFFTSFDGKNCNTCGVALVPSRFVIACPRGHIDDFPYFRWVHAGSAPTGDTHHEMHIQSAGVSASLRDILIDCSCGKGMSMEGAFGRDALRPITPCTGRRPWLSEPAEVACPELPVPYSAGRPMSGIRLFARRYRFRRGRRAPSGRSIDDGPCFAGSLTMRPSEAQSRECDWRNRVATRWMTYSRPHRNVSAATPTARKTGPQRI